MKVFETKEEVDDMLPCVKRNFTVYAKPIFEEFRVKTLEGDYKLGKCGDFLMRGIDGELYICDSDIFRKTYDFILPPPSSNG